MSSEALWDTPEILRIVAPNPGPMTLEGTNTYLYGSDPCMVIDPGPDDAGHLDAVRAAAEERGGIGLVLLTHGHGDHADGAERLGVEVVLPGDGEEHGGLRAIATPGHAPDHVCLLTADGVCFSGDLVLGEGSTFVPPDGGSLSRLHGLAAAHAGRADRADLPRPRPLDRPTRRRSWPSTSSTARCASAACSPPWSAASAPARPCSPRPGADVPAELRPAAAMVMQAHLEKLEAEGRLASRPASLTGCGR